MPPPLPKQDEKAIDEELSFSHISYEMVMDMIKINAEMLFLKFISLILIKIDREMTW